MCVCVYINMCNWTNTQTLTWNPQFKKNKYQETACVCVGGGLQWPKKTQNSLMELRLPLPDKTEKQGLDLSSCLKQTKKNTRDNGFQDTRHQAMKNSDPWEMGKNEVSPMTAPVYCLKRVSKPENKEKLRQNLADFLNWQTWESGYKGS